MMNDDLLMVNGYYPKPPREGAPEFVMGKVNINVQQFKEWFRDYLKANPDQEWLTIDSLVSKNGKGYGKIDTWKPEPQAAAPQPAVEDDDLPF